MRSFASVLVGLALTTQASATMVVRYDDKPNLRSTPPPTPTPACQHNLCHKCEPSRDPDTNKIIAGPGSCCDQTDSCYWDRVFKEFICLPDYPWICSPDLTLDGSPKVTVQLFAESLCPDCINYAQTQLAPLMADHARLVDLTVYPYGNAEETENSDGTYSFSCQHGNNECTANMYEACAILHFPSIVKASGAPAWFPFFDCMEVRNGLVARRNVNASEALP